MHRFFLVRFASFLTLSLCCLSGMWNSTCLAEAKFPDGTKYVKASLVSNTERMPYVPRTQSNSPVVQIGVHFEIEPGWHIYWKNPGEAATATRIQWKVPPSVEVNSDEVGFLWPTPYRFLERGDITTYGYKDEVLLSTSLMWSRGALPPKDSRLRLSADVSWLVCKDICVPGRTSLSHTISTSRTGIEIPSDQAKLFSEFRAKTPSPHFTSSAMRSLASPSQLSMSKADVRPASSFVATLLLPGFNASSSEAAAKRLQVFPHASDTLTYGKPFVAHLSEEAGAPGGSLVNIPISVSGDAKDSEAAIEFTLALEDSNGDTESREFVGAISVSNNAKETNIQHDLSEYTQDFAPLTYRIIAHTDAPSLPKARTTIALSSISLLGAILSAFIGGMLLNLMPCVLPILSLKLMGCITAYDKKAKEARRSALAYSLGILASFMVLAAVVVLLKSMGLSIGWGFQFQYPGFVAGLALVVFLLGLGFFDVYTVHLPGMQSANQVVGNLHPSFAKHFFDGVLTTALSTPCTAPFLGAALLVAFSQSAAITFLLFFFVGLGLALPYAFFTMSPKLLCYLPKPGAWMCRVRQFMGFLLFGTVLWLLFVLHRLTAEGVIWALSIMLVLYFSFWLFDWANLLTSKRWKIAARTTVAISCLAFVVFCFPLLTARSSSQGQEYVSSQGIKWQVFSDEAVETARAQGNPVFLEFTADWCITCKANEYMVIETAGVAQALRENGILAFKADWTSGDPVITDAIKRYGAEGVPLYVVLPADVSAAPTVLPSLITSSSLINAFDQVKSSKN